MLEAEKRALKEEINKTISGFDQGLSQLEEYKLKLAYELKMAQMKFVTFYQELLKLNKMEPQDNDLTGKISKANNEKNEILLEQEEINKRLDKVKQEADEVEKKRQEIIN